ncbi:MAG: hypothetical protein RLZZ385_289 [Pseudomonadota bacterium]|jgi:uncharacterized membrane protein YdbT with pleckstrin-like domain
MTTLYSENPVMFKNNPLGFMLCILLVPAFGVGLLLLLYWYVQTRATRLTVNEKEIIFEKGLLSKEHAEVNISSVRTVKVRQTFFNRVFGVGTVEIFTAGDTPEIIAKGLPDPNRIRELI